MADQGAQERNLPASARKLRKAREDGQLPRSRDLGHFAALVTALGLMVAMAPVATTWLQALLASGLRFDARNVANPAAMGERLGEFTSHFLWAVLPIGFITMAVGFAAGIALGGWNWTMKPLAPKFEKFNLVSSLPKLLSADKLIDTLRTCLLALVLAGVGGSFFAAHLEGFAALGGLPLPGALAQAGSSVLQGVMLLVLTLAVFALIDVPIQKHQHAKRLKMSHQDVKQEHKETEGNTEVKARVRQIMRDRLRRSMMAAVPKADLVVMNPTHYAVALKYEEGTMTAPRVVAKGADLFALRIRDLAKASDVPVLQAPVLARALYAHAEVDREIPVALYSAVAQVLAYVYQLRAAFAGRAPMPGDLPELPVPQELDPHHGKTPAA